MKTQLPTMLTQVWALHEASSLDATRKWDPTNQAQQLLNGGYLLSRRWPRLLFASVQRPGGWLATSSATLPSRLALGGLHASL